MRPSHRARFRPAAIVRSLPRHPRPAAFILCWIPQLGFAFRWRSLQIKRVRAQHHSGTPGFRASPKPSVIVTSPDSIERLAPVNGSCTRAPLDASAAHARRNAARWPQERGTLDRNELQPRGRRGSSAHACQVARKFVPSPNPRSTITNCSRPTQRDGQIVAAQKHLPCGRALRPRLAYHTP